jgi:hypothetical protein
MARRKHQAGSTFRPVYVLVHYNMADWARNSAPALILSVSETGDGMKARAEYDEKQRAKLAGRDRAELEWMPFTGTGLQAQCADGSFYRIEVHSMAEVSHFEATC